MTNRVDGRETWEASGSWTAVHGTLVALLCLVSARYWEHIDYCANRVFLSIYGIAEGFSLFGISMLDLRKSTMKRVDDFEMSTGNV